MDLYFSGLVDDDRRVLSPNLMDVSCLVIPSTLQQLLGFEEGARFAGVSKNRSLVDELIAQRREATKQEIIE